MMAIFFLLLVFAITSLDWLPFGLALVYFTLSALTFLVYGLDKLLALKQKTRVSEKKLQLLALAGGWPGAYIAQQIFQHKISKQTFRRTFFLMLAINMMALCTFLILIYQQGQISLDLLLG